LEQFPRLLPDEPVAQPGSLLPDVGYIGEAGRLGSEHPVTPGSFYELARGREPNVNSRRTKCVHRRPPPLQQGPGEWLSGRKGKQLIEGMAVGQLRACRRDRIEHHVAQLPLGRGQARRRTLEDGQGAPGGDSVDRRHISPSIRDLQRLFELQPRAAQKFIEMLPAVTIGTSRLVEREALASFLERVQEA